MVEKANSIEELIATCPQNQVIGDNLIRAWSKINSSKYNKILCALSGGSDSDIVLDIVYKCDKDNKVDYVWYNTGIEYEATKRHLKYLEDKYEIKIITEKPIKTVPLACKQYGQPFISKYASDMISRLQAHGFKWEDKTYEELNREYSNVSGALKWWTNSNGEKSSFNIERNKWLKEFLLEYKPSFNVSYKCCNYAKKNIAHKVIADGGYDLNITGVRKSEGGIRATSYKNCFDESDNGCDNYRPIFWYKDSDKIDYENTYNIKHSDCYTKYRLKRTGCAGCPYGKNFEYELEVIQKYEPKLYKAVNNIFGDSYEYTKKYREFCKKKNDENKSLKE